MILDVLKTWFKLTEKAKIDVTHWVKPGATALYYSLMVTAQINGLRVYDYVQYILDNMSGAIYGKQPRNTVEMDALLDELMPWSSLMQEKFEAPWMQELTAN